MLNSFKNAVKGDENARPKSSQASYLAKLFQERSQANLVFFDETIVHQASVEDLSEKLYKRFLTLRTSEDHNILLSKLSILKKDENQILCPTVSGILLACPYPEKFLPTAFIQAVAYRGTEIAPRNGENYQLDAQDITGPLDEQIYDACRFVRRNMKVPGYKGGEVGGRSDLPQYDLIAVFDPTITSLLARLPIRYEYLKSWREFIMDRRGEGVFVIINKSEKLSGKTPQYRMLGREELMLTIYASDVGEWIKTL